MNGIGALRLPRLDVAMSAGLVAFGVAEASLLADVPHRVPAAVAEAMMALAIAWRRARPLAAVSVVGGAVVAATVAGLPPEQATVPLVSMVVMVYTVVSYCPPRDAAIGVGLVVVALFLQVWLAGQSWDNLAFAFTFIGIFWALGRIVRIRSAQAVESELRAERLQGEHSERVRRVVTEERARIARELHDLIAHSVSVMVVQAGAAQQVLRNDPRLAEQALEHVQRTGRESIRELGGLLGILREDSAETGFAPQPTLAELPQLVEEARTAGLTVELTTEGEPVDLQAGVELAVYRVVQEALTNTRKHAGTRPTATVRLAYGPRDVHVEVVDDGPGEGAPAAYGTGHGLVGIRERVTAYGGTLEAGGHAGRGYRISARIPIGAAE